MSRMSVAETPLADQLPTQDSVAGSPEIVKPAA